MSNRQKFGLAVIGLSIGLVLLTQRIKSKQYPSVLFDHLRTRATSQRHPGFTQIKRVTLRRVQADTLELTMQMAAPIALSPQDRYVAEVHILANVDRGYKPQFNPKQAIIVFPLGSGYPDSQPYVAPGSAGVVALVPMTPVHYEYELLGETKYSVHGATLRATFSSQLLSDTGAAWSDKMLVALVRYAPAKNIVKAKKGQFSMRNAVVDVEKLSPTANVGAAQLLYP